MNNNQIKLHEGNIAAEKRVEIDIRHDGLDGINVDGICVCRVLTNGFISIKVTDNRQ